MLKKVLIITAAIIFIIIGYLAYCGFFAIVDSRRHRLPGNPALWTTITLG